MNNEITNNTETSNNIEKKRGIVKNFAGFTPAMLHSMKYDVGLTMSVEQLAELCQYYRLYARRDPSLDELYLLDRLLELRYDIDRPITKLATSSDSLAETYADMMAKRSAIKHPDTPPTPAELQDIGSKYLQMIGKTSDIGDKYIFAHGDLAKTKLLLNGCADSGMLSTAHTAMGMFTPKSSPAAGDLLILLSPGADMGYADFNRALTHLLSRDGVKGGRVIDRRGIINAACHWNKGVYIDTAALPVPQPCELTALCDACHGNVLTAVSHEQTTAFILRASQLGIQTFVIGSLTSDNKFTAHHHHLGAVALHIKFINNPTSESEFHANLQENRAKAQSKQHGSNSISVSNDSSLILSTHQVCFPHSPFTASLNATLCAISDCVAQGADYKQACLSAEIQAPHNAPDIDVMLECLLGIYRAQIEFCIVDRDSCLSLTSTAEPTVTISAAVRRSPIIGNAQISEATLYLLRPQINDNGLPSFEELRRMWDYVTRLVRAQEIILARAVSLDGIDASIQSLLGDDMTFTPSAEYTQKLSSSEEYGGILALSAGTIDGFALGTVNKY